MEIESAFVTGANRGLGFEMVKQLLHSSKPPELVFATYRNKDAAKDLENLKKESKDTELVLIQMDVKSVQDIKAAWKVVEDKVKDKGLNLLINNAGVQEPLGFTDITEESMQLHLATNTVGPVMIFKELLPLLQKSAERKGKGTALSVSRAAVLNITTAGASITDVMDDGISDPWLPSLAYRVSKTAMIMAMRMIAVTVKEKGILVVIVSPGWIKTDMGTREAPSKPSEAVSALFVTLAELNESHQGAILDKDGKAIPF